MSETPAAASAHSSAALAPLLWGIDAPSSPNARTIDPAACLFEGWMYSLEQVPVWGRITADGMPPVSFTTAKERPDVVAHFKQRFEVPLHCGFSVTVPLPPDRGEQVAVTVVLGAGGWTSAPLTYVIERPKVLSWPPPRPVLGSKPGTTLITHFYNEEYLLPLWLRHHLPLFDHGILINRGSTDRSVAICKELAPHWEVRSFATPEFDVEGADHEVMELEREASGWKIVLTLAELLCCRSGPEFFSSLSAYDHRAYGITMVTMVDPPDVPYPELDLSRPVSQQRHHGHISAPRYGFRFIHHHEDGAYSTGRHQIAHEFALYPRESAVIMKLAYTPWNEAMKRRKLQIAPTFSEKTRAKNLAIAHPLSEEQMQTRYERLVSMSGDLREIDQLRWLFPKPTPAQPPSWFDRLLGRRRKVAG